MNELLVLAGVATGLAAAIALVALILKATGLIRLLPDRVHVEEWDEADDMCPNCVTPWHCNGPHEP